MLFIVETIQIVCFCYHQPYTWENNNGKVYLLQITSHTVLRYYYHTELKDIFQDFLKNSEANASECL